MLSAESNDHIWIDTDPVSRRNQTADIDDVLAVRMLRESGIRIAGISTTHGNGATSETWRSAVAEFGAAPLHRGLAETGCANPVVVGLAEALRSTALTILAHGPLTSIAQLLDCHPHLAGRISRIIAVAGRAPEERPRHGTCSAGVELRDLNYEADRTAFRTVLASAVPVDLDLSRFCASPGARSGDFSFEYDRAFPAKC